MRVFLGNVEHDSSSLARLRFDREECAGFLSSRGHIPQSLVGHSIGRRSSDGIPTSWLRARNFPGEPETNRMLGLRRGSIEPQIHTDL